MRARVRLLICAVPAVLLMVWSVARAAEPPAPHLLIIPARHTVVQFAFDVARLRSVYLVSYSVPEGGDTPLLHVWDARAERWVGVNLDEFGDATIFRVVPRRCVLVGDDRTLPQSLADAAGWCPDAVRIPSLNIADLANQLNMSLEFRPREWRWLAARYGFVLEDLNAGRRRQGRYSRPGPRPAPPPEPVAPIEPLDEDIPPAVLHVEPAPQAVEPPPPAAPAARPMGGSLSAPAVPIATDQAPAGIP